MFKATITRAPSSIGSKGWQKQAVWIYLYNGDGTACDFPSEFSMLVEGGKPGLPVGDYTVDPSSFVMARDEKGNQVLRVGRLKLNPLPKSGGKA